MTKVELAKKYYDYFELCFKDDNWERLEEIFAQDAVYEIKGKSPMKSVIKGRDNIIAGFQLSINNFDRKLDSRSIVYGTEPVEKNGVVSYRLDAVYTKKGYPDLVFPAWSKLYFENDMIVKEVDIYKATNLQTLKALGWYAKYSEKLGINANYK